MTVYVVPCGVSLLDGLTAKKDKGPRDCKPARLTKNAADLGRAVLGLPDADVVRWWADNASKEAADARLDEWDPHVLSAEANTLAATSRLGRLRCLLDRSDRLLVLASDTERGAAAALYLAQHIAGPALPDVVYQSTPDTLASEPVRATLAAGTLTVLRLRGLDPRHVSGAFIDAVAGVGMALRAAFDVGEPLEVHLTGGFKATLLHTLAMTELLYSFAPDRVRACYLFEDVGSPYDDVIQIGMREFSQAHLDGMRQELIAIRDGKRYLGDPTLAGIAAAGHGGLNAFGYGYLAVLGERLTPGRPGPGGR